MGALAMVKCFGPTARLAFGCSPGPYRHRREPPAGAMPVRGAPHPGQCFSCAWYSVTTGGGGGDASNTCSFCTPRTGSPTSPCPQRPHAAGPQNTVTSGWGDCLSVDDCAPGCFPGLRPDLPRSDRSRGLRYGPSDDGGFDDVEESLSSRRRNSSTCAASAAICASRTASCAAASSSRAAAASRRRALSSSTSATRARSHATSSDAGTCGVSDTSRTPPQPADRYQDDTPGQLRATIDPS